MRSFLSSISDGNELRFPLNETQLNKLASNPAVQDIFRRISSIKAYEGLTFDEILAGISRKRFVALRRSLHMDVPKPEPTLKEKLHAIQTGIPGRQSLRKLVKWVRSHSKE